MQRILKNISTQAVIILLVSTPTLIAVAFWSIVNPALTVVFLMIVACFARPFRQFVRNATDPAVEN